MSITAGRTWRDNQPPITNDQQRDDVMLLPGESTFNCRTSTQGRAALPGLLVQSTIEERVIGLSSSPTRPTPLAELVLRTAN